MKKKIAFLAAFLTAASLGIGTGAAGFEKTAEYVPGQFADIPQNEWYADEVKSTYELGLMNGVGGNLFAPEGNVTVAEAITMAARAASINAGEAIPDVEGEWYAKYVSYALDKGFVTEGQFDNYDRAAKRREVAVLFESAMPDGYFAAQNDVSAIPDVSDKQVYHDELLTLYKAGVVMGSDSYGNFFPENNITRAEAAAIINRVALPANRLSKTLDKISDDDAYSLILTSAMTHGTEGIASGWVLDNRGGLPRTSLTEPYGSLFDVDDTAPTALIRSFNKTETGVITLYTKASISGEDGIYLALRNQAGKDVYRLQTEDKSWRLLRADGSFEQLYAFTADETVFEFEITVDIDNARSTTYINGKFCGVYPLAVTQNVDLSSFRWATTEQAIASVSPSRINAYANYALRECFEYAATDTLPNGWSGSALSNGAELKVEKEQYAAASFLAASGTVAAEFEVLLPQAESVCYALRSGEKNIAVFTSDQKNFYVNGIKVYDSYYKNQWYRMRFELDTVSGNILVKLNGRKIADVPFADSTTSVDNLTVSNNSGTAVLFDNFKVFRLVEHDDYVPQPVLPTGTDKYTVGMNVCSLWTNGTGSTGGWNCISAYKDVEPVLGYYDEGLPETADWEIKYTLEHGIDFQAFCVFFTSGWGTEPQRVSATHLYDGFMNAKYSDQAKFSIIWEAANAPSPYQMETWKQSFVPYIIENYFKDPRYITLENRPILCVFGAGELSDRIGGDAKVKEMFDYLEDEVKKLGFDGVIYLACGSGSDRLAAMGFDGCYAYNWGSNGYQLDVNKNSILASAN
ncbi:MAG: S-layer homology domain-containing protein, partial [Eubacteriales bacterium]